jgi:hypothetical protein
MAQKDAFSHLSGVDPSVRPIYVAGWRTGADPITTFVIIFSPFFRIEEFAWNSESASDISNGGSCCHGHWSR